MNEIELPGILRRMSVETGSLVCLGCGHERSCSTHGCAILKDAADTIEQLLDERAQAVMDAGIAWACRSCKLREKRAGRSGGNERSRHVKC